MTEQEWQACTDPTPMLAFLRGKASDRKVRLFGCACVRRVWYLLADARSRNAVEVAESFADWKVSKQSLAAARSEAITAAVERSGYAAYAACYAAEPGLTIDQVTSSVAETVVDVWEWEINDDGSPQPEAGLSQHSASRGFEQRGIQVFILRDIFGNPFRPVSINPECLAWKDGFVVELAQTIYNERAFDRLPILADALEEAGCDDADILDHCRQPSDHVRGCWVVDLLLGKE